MKPSALVYDFLFLGLTLLFISLVSADLQQIKDQSALDDVKKSPSGSIVFFNHSSEKPGRELVLFIKEFEKAAKVLEDYGIKFYKVDCNTKSVNVKDECRHSRNYVVAYSLGKHEEMGISILFDEDHIVGHILMFLLQNDVAIAQDRYMWDEILLDNRGSKDIILSIVRGLGDKDHRYFMETAFVYGKHYKFVVTTEKAMPGVKGDAALWYYSCKGIHGGKECPYKTRKMPPNSVVDVLRFIKVNDLPRIVEIMQNGSSMLDKQDVTIPLNKVYLFSKDVEQARSLASEAIKEVDDSFFFILVDVVAHLDLLPEFGVDPAIEWEKGVITLVLQPAHLISTEEKYYEQWPTHLSFDLKNVVTLLNNYHRNPNDAYVDIVSNVNIVYESIQEWKKPKEGISVVGGCLKEMSDCVGFNIAFRRLCRSITYSDLEEGVDMTYVDFTGSSNDASLNSLPAFKIYKNGKEYNHAGHKDYESLLEFTWDNLSSKVLRFPLSGSDHMPLMPSEYEAQDDDLGGQKQLLEMEDDSMGRLAVDIVERKVQDELVTALTDKTFNSTRESNELMVSLFYLPWCVKSIIVREVYAQVVKRIEEMKTSNDISTAVNKVNCFNWEDVCRKEHIVAYPTIKVYRKGLHPLIYSSSLDVKTMISTIKRYQAPVLTELKDSKTLEAFLDVDTPKSSPVSVVGLFESTDSKNLQAFTNAAQLLFGKYTFAFATGNIARESARGHQFPMPSFVLLKRDDPVERITGSKDFSKISDFIEENSLPFYGELTAINFPKYRMYGKPFVIHFKDSNDTVSDSALQILAIQASSIFVTWMDKSKKVTQDIMRAYMSSLESGIVFVSHEQGNVYKYGGKVDENDLWEWVDQCIRKQLKPTTTLSDKQWLPLRKGIDYLAMIEKRQREKSENQLEDDAVGEVDVDDSNDEQDDSNSDEQDDSNNDEQDDSSNDEQDGKDLDNESGNDEDREPVRDEL